MLKETSGNCIFLERFSCAIYAERPLTCKLYPFFLEESSENNFQFGVTKEKCPGFGQGRLLEDVFFLELLETAVRKILSR
jgi:Fe-S-cluster containining protein